MLLKVTVFHMVPCQLRHIPISPLVAITTQVTKEKNHMMSQEVTKSLNMSTHEMNKTHTHFLIREHFCLSQTDRFLSAS